MADYLDTEEVVVEYLAAAMEGPSPDVLLAAIGDVAKARGMAEIADETGLGRESRHKALSTGSHPRYETIAAVPRPLGVKFTVEATEEQDGEERRRRESAKRPPYPLHARI